MPINKLSPTEQTAYLRLLIDSTLEGFYSVDTHGHTTLCNAAFLRHLGYDQADDVIGRNLRDVIRQAYPDGTPVSEVDDPILKAAVDGSRAHVPHALFLRRDGSALPVEYRVQPIIQDGRLKGALCTFNDISDRVRAEAELGVMTHVAEAASERINLALDSGTVVGTWVWDVKNDLVVGDERFARAFGVAEEAARAGLPLSDAFGGIHPDDHEALSAAIQVTLDEDKPFRAEYRIRKDDGWCWIEASGGVERNAAGEPVRFPGVLVDIDARKVAELALKDAHDQLRLAQNAGGVIGSWAWNLAQNLVIGDESFGRTFGIAPERLRAGVPLETIGLSVHPDDLPGMTTAIVKTMTTGEPCSIDYRIRRGEGWLWVNAIGKAELNADGVAISQSGIIIDIDARKQIEQALEESHSQLRMAQKVGGIGVFAVTSDGDRIAVSPEFCDIFGLPVTAHVSLTQTAKLVLTEDDHAKSTPADRADGSTPVETEYRIRRADNGEIRWIYRRAEFLRDADDAPLHMVGMVQDITARKTAEQALSESKRQLELITDAIPQQVWTARPDGQLDYVNGHTREYSGDVLIVDGIVQWGAIVHPDDLARTIPVWMHSLQTGEPYESEQRIFHKASGQYRWNLSRARAVHDETGAIIKWYGTNTDIEDSKLTQQAMLEARNAAEAANIAKTEFLANMSHEIRTPMNAIIGLSSILAKSQPLTPRQGDFIRTLQTSADALLALINDLLDIAKIEARSVELEHIPFSLAGIMQEVASMMAVQVRDKGLRFHGDGECVEGRTFVGDPTRVRQIITNLCSNAIKFTDEGEVHVAITCDSPEQGEGDDSTEIICIAVTDSGIGIAPDKIDHVFHKFVQADNSINRKYGGTGLGLAITKTLAEIMGGTISVTSEEGRGSTFTVCLPLEEARDMAVQNDASVAEAIDNAIGADRPTVLLVEDYEPNILVAVTFLEDFGYRVDIANNGMEAFELAKANRYTAILMDVQMHGMNGLDATRMIRDHEARQKLMPARIIGMTAHALSGDRERCLGVGMDDYIAKPYNPQDLRRKLRGE